MTKLNLTEMCQLMEHRLSWSRHLVYKITVNMDSGWSLFITLVGTVSTLLLLFQIVQGPVAVRPDPIVIHASSSGIHRL